MWEKPDKDRNKIKRKMYKNGFILTKLLPPSSGFKLIPRPSLLSALNEVCCFSALFLIAPAGYGKTSLLSQWKKNKKAMGENCIGWISLDEDDADIRRFVSYLVLSMARAGGEVADLEQAAQHGFTEIPRQNLLALLITAIESSSQNITLILDDYHRIKSNEINQFIQKLIERSPGSFHLIICSRTRPNLDTASLIARGKACEFDANTLRFSKKEVQKIFTSDLEPELIHTIYQKTEGWAVAVQLAGLAMKKSRSNIVLHTFSGTQSHLARYFVEQILNQLSEPLIDFLVKTSVLDCFNISLANAVCEITNTENIMNESTEIGLLLIPLDPQGQWFRYHHLLSKFLMEWVKKNRKYNYTDLHKRASLWFEKQGKVIEAVRHAKHAEDSDRCAELILDAGGWELILYGGIGYIRTLLRYMEEEDYEYYPRLQIARAYLCLKEGEVLQALAYLDSILFPSESDLITGEPYKQALRRDYILIRMLYRIYQDQITGQSEFDGIMKTLEGFPEEDALGKGVLLCVAALSAMARGKNPEAETLASEALENMREAKSVLGMNYSLLHIGQAAYHQGEFKKAEQCFFKATVMAEKNFGSDSGLKSICDVVNGTLAFWSHPQNTDFFQVFSHIFRRQYTSLKTICEGDGWFEIYFSGFTTMLEYGLYCQSPEYIQKTLQMTKKVIETRRIARLEFMVPILELYQAIITDQRMAALAVCKKIQEKLPFHPQKQNLWVFYVYTALAEGLFALYHPPSTKGALLRLSLTIKEYKNADKNLYLIRLLILRGTLKIQNTGFLRSAVNDIYRASLLASEEKIYTPFLLFSETQRLIHLALKDSCIREKCRSGTTFLLEVRKKFPKQNFIKSTKLSLRENEVLHQLSLGKSNKEIARSLKITHNTVKFHLKNIFIKLKVKTRIQALNAIKMLERTKANALIE